MSLTGKPMVVTDERINSYGTRLLTRGWVNRAAFEDNAVMYYNHKTESKGAVPEPMTIGYWINFTDTSDNAVEATPVIDDEDEGLGAKVAGKYKRKVIRGASFGVEILEMSDDPRVMLPGQSIPTITKWRSVELSMTERPSNNGCLHRFYDAAGNTLNLSDMSAKGTLPIIQNHSEKQKSPKMEDKNFLIVAAFMGFSDTATPADVQAKITQLQLKAAKVDSLEKQLAEIQKKQKEDNQKTADLLLTEAVKDGRITDVQRPHFINLFDTNFDSAKSILEGMEKRVNLTDKIKSIPGGGGEGDEFKYKGKTFLELRKEAPETLANLKANDKETFGRLYKAQYNKDFDWGK